MLRPAQPRSQVLQSATLVRFLQCLRQPMNHRSNAGNKPSALTRCCTCERTHRDLALDAVEPSLADHRVRHVRVLLDVLLPHFRHVHVVVRGQLQRAALDALGRMADLEGGGREGGVRKGGEGGREGGRGEERDRIVFRFEDQEKHGCAACADLLLGKFDAFMGLGWKENNCLTFRGKHGTCSLLSGLQPDEQQGTARCAFLGLVNLGRMSHGPVWSSSLSLSSSPFPKDSFGQLTMLFQCLSKKAI